jgi:hypothetical protein
MVCSTLPNWQFIMRMRYQFFQTIISHLQNENFNLNTITIGFSSNKWTDGRRRYVLLKRQSQIQLQYVYHHHRICLYILLNYSDFTDNSSAVLLNSVRSNIIHFILERLSMNKFVDFHLLLYSNWNFHFANVILSFERIDSAFALLSVKSE